MKKISLNSGWQFAYGEPGMQSRRTFVTVDLPHDYAIGQDRVEGAVGKASVGYFPGGYGEYKKELFIPAEWKDHKILLDIDGAYMNAEVICGRTHLVTHPYGYTAFRADLTGCVTPGSSATITVTTQSRQQNSRWYSGAGLYRGVNLLVGPADSIDPWELFLRAADVTDASARIVAEYKEPLAIEVYDGDKLIASGEGEVTLVNPRLWSPEDPFLYTVKLTNRSGDVHEQAFGVKSVEISPKGMLLNGRPIKLKGGCIHHDNGPLGACSFPAAEERKIRLLKNMGYNSVRIAHNPASQALLDACDKLGMLVMNEAFDCWVEGKNSQDYHLYFRDWWDRDIDSMVLSSRNHTSVFSYSIGNEISERDGHNDGAAWSEKLAARVRKNDPTRPVTAALNNLYDPAAPRKQRSFQNNLSLNQIRTVDFENDYWGRMTKDYAAPLDIVGYNYLVLRYAHDREAFPDRVIVGTETFPYFTYDYWMGTIENDNVIGDYIWTAFDYLGEAGIGRVLWEDDPNHGFLGEYPWHQAWCGDIDICGFLRPQAKYREILWGKKDQVSLFAGHPERHGKVSGGNGWQWRDVDRIWNFEDKWIGQPVHVEAYADADEVAFLMSGEEVARVKVNRLMAEADVPYAPGVLTAVAYRGSLEIGRDALETAGEPVRMEMSCDRPVISADGMDLCYITLKLYDSEGRRVYHKDREITVSVSGAAKFVAIGTNDPKGTESYASDRRTTKNGKLVAIVRAGQEAGEAAITAVSQGIPASTVKISVK